MGGSGGVSLAICFSCVLSLWLAVFAQRQSVCVNRVCFGLGALTCAHESETPADSWLCFGALCSNVFLLLFWRRRCSFCLV